MVWENDVSRIKQGHGEKCVYENGVILFGLVQCEKEKLGLHVTFAQLLWLLSPSIYGLGISHYSH